MHLRSYIARKGAEASFGFVDSFWAAAMGAMVFFIFFGIIAVLAILCIPASSKISSDSKQYEKEQQRKQIKAAALAAAAASPAVAGTAVEASKNIFDDTDMADEWLFSPEYSGLLGNVYHQD